MNLDAVHKNAFADSLHNRESQAMIGLMKSFLQSAHGKNEILALQITDVELTSIQEKTCKLLLSEILQFEFSCSHEFSLRMWLYAYLTNNFEGLSVDEFFETPLSVDYDDNSKHYEPLLAMLDKRFDDAEKRDRFKRLLLQGFRIHDVPIQKIFSTTEACWKPCFEWLLQRGDLGNYLLLDYDEITPELLLDCELNKDKGVEVPFTWNNKRTNLLLSRRGDIAPEEITQFTELMDACSLLKKVPISGWKKLATFEQCKHANLRFLYHQCDLIPQILKNCEKYASESFSPFAKSIKKKISKSAVPGLSLTLASLQKKYRGIRTGVESIRSDLRLVRQGSIPFGLLVILFQDCQRLDAALKTMIQFTDNFVKNIGLVGEKKANQKLKQELTQRLLPDDLRLFSDMLPPIIKFLSGIHDKVNPAHVRLFSIATYTSHDLIGWYHLIETAKEADFPEMELIYEDSSIRVIETNEIPSLDDLLQDGANIARTWSSRLHYLAEDLVEKNKNELDLLPFRLKTAAHHSLCEIGCQLELATLGIEMIAEALRDENGDKLALALQNCYRNMALAMEQHYAFKYILKNRDYSFEHNLNKLKAEFEVTPKLSKLSNDYHLALFWVRFLVYHANRHLNFPRFVDLRKLWESKPKDFDLNGMITRTVDDYICLMQELLDERLNPFKKEELERLKALVVVLQEKRPPTLPSSDWCNPTLAVLVETILAKLPTQRGRQPDVYDCLIDACHLLHTLDLGLGVADYEKRENVRFWHDINIGQLDKIAELIYQAMCYSEGLGKVDARHKLQTFQEILGMLDEPDAKALRNVNLGIRHHYAEFPMPETEIEKAYGASLRRSRGIPDVPPENQKTFRQMITEAIPALEILVARLEKGCSI